ncbi:FecR protein [Gimesia maris]|uniref:LamG-like jellyroll fold domain-containing protein n=1 Tax=Gimesia maris TaxID=122 RepID=UPI00118C31C4|nr:LamG-like jellyroll fold domain-containing protein [Gimesia maris]QDU13584.1 FecR protein [Gimesia maris]
MLTPEEREELMQLCWEYQYGNLSSRQAGRLEKLVLQSDSARDFFIQYSGMCANLEWEGIVDPGPLGRSSDYEPLPSGELKTIPDHLLTETVPPDRRIILSTILACTICALAAAYLLTSAFLQNKDPRVLARIINIKNAVWSEGKNNWQPDDVLRAGDQIHLRSGIIELETVTGAKVILKGVSQLTLIQPDQFMLNQGNLFAHVPLQSQGLTVDTPSSRVVDLGTSFGLIVTPDRETEVHVLQGLVRFDLLDEKRQTTITQDLTENTAVRVQADSRKITRFKSTPELFVQNLVPDQPQLVAHWKLSDRETSQIAHDSGEHLLHLNILEVHGQSPFTGRPAPQNIKSSAGPFETQYHKLFRTLSEQEASLFDMQRFTIELWARNPNIKQQGDSDTLFHYRNTNLHSTSQFNLFTDDHSGRMGFGFLNSDNQYVSFHTKKNIPWEQDRWYHIVFTYDSNTSAAHDSIVTFTRTPEFSSQPDLQQTFINIADITPLTPGGILAIGGSTLTDISRHWGGDISDVRFINGIPARYLKQQNFNKK